MITIKKQTFFTIALISFLVGLGSLVVTSQVQAVFVVPTPVCGEGEHVGNPHCLPSVSPTAVPTPTKKPCKPTVTVEPSVEVTVSPTASPTAEVTVEPTVQPQSPHGDGLSDGRESGHINAPSIPKGAPKTGRAS